MSTEQKEWPEIAAFASAPTPGFPTPERRAVDFALRVAADSLQPSTTSKGEEA